MLRYRQALLSFALLAVTCAWPGDAPAQERSNSSRTIFGYVERVIISDQGFSVKAKLDTGAETSSLDAHNIQRFRRGGDRYVRFEVIDPETGNMITLERELARTVRIRQHNRPPVQRPVIKMWLCIGHLMQRVEVNLTPRTDFIYPLLVGRSAMRGAIIVDPDLSFTSRPRCDPEEFIE
jgi:hypothetical protein